MTLVKAAPVIGLVGLIGLVGGIALSAGTAPIRLLGVSLQGSAIVIEATEPAAYAVKRPDPLTLLVELRNVSVGDALNLVERRGAVAGVVLEQASATDGKALARIRVSLARPSGYKVQSTRNTIRLELTALSQVAPSLTAVPAPGVPAAPGVVSPPATLLERVRSRSETAATTVTLSGNGRLTPASVMESLDRPRRLVLDFPEVSSRAPAQTTLEGSLVTRVRVGVNSRNPLVTRVVIDVTEGATYHVVRAGSGGRDLAVVFQPPQTPDAIAVATSHATEPEPDIPLHQAIANAASITPKDDALDPIAALKSARLAAPSSAAPAVVSRPQPPPPSSAAPSSAAPSAATPSAAAPATMPRMPVQTPQAPAPAPPGSQQITSTTEKKYQGYPITLDFAGVDLRTVLRQFAEISGLNIILDPGIPSTPVDIVLKDVPWDQAFETLLRGYKLGYIAEGTIIRIAPIAVLSEEEAELRKLSEAKALSGDLRVQTFALSYAKANDLQALLVKSALSSRGQIQVDTRTNTLIISDLADRLQTATALIGVLDRPEPQVEVEARVVQTTREFAKAIGVQWGFNGRATPEIGNTTGLAFPNRGTLGGRTGGTNSPSDVRATGLDTTATAVNLGVPGPTSAIGLALGAVNGALNLDVALSALERTGKGRVLSSPRLTTQNNVAAEVAQGIQIPIQTVANNTVTVSFKEAVLLLKVTPQITSANTVIMQITIENANADFSRQVNGIPPIDTQRATTQVQVDDGATTIIGGIFVSREQASNERTPVLHRLPLLGWLFKRDTASDESRELLIFITPRILRG